MGPPPTVTEPSPSRVRTPLNGGFIPRHPQADLPHPHMVSLTREWITSHCKIPPDLEFHVGELAANLKRAGGRLGGLPIATLNDTQACTK